MEQFENIPQPYEIPHKEREQALAAYLMMFATAAAGLPLPFLNLIASFAYYYFTKSTSRFVRFHSYQSLISQIPISLMNGVAVFWGFRILFTDLTFSNPYKGYLVVVVLSNFVYVLFSLIAAIKAYKGRMVYFVFFGKLAYMKAFSAHAEAEEALAQQNLPPRL